MILDRLFGAPEEINGDNRCPTYLYRWIVTRREKFSVYIHKFVGDDWSLDLHDHPKWFISIGIKGDYVEHTPKRTHIYFAPWIRWFPPEHKHRITCPFGVVWTIVIVGPVRREWGFWHLGKWVPWREYVKSDAAHLMKSCD